MKAVGKNVVLVMEKQEKTKQGFYMPDSALNKGKVEIGVVESVGGEIPSAGLIIPGVRVIIKAERGITLPDNFGSENYRIVEYNDILAIL